MNLVELPPMFKSRPDARLLAAVKAGGVAEKDPRTLVAGRFAAVAAAGQGPAPFRKKPDEAAVRGLTRRPIHQQASPRRNTPAEAAGTPLRPILLSAIAGLISGGGRTIRTPGQIFGLMD